MRIHRRRRPAAFAGLVALCLGAAACQLISGVDDFTFRDGESDPDGALFPDATSHSDATTATDAPVGTDAPGQGDATEPLDAAGDQDAGDAADATDAGDADATTKDGGIATWTYTFYKMPAEWGEPDTITAGPDQRLWFTATTGEVIVAVAMDGGMTPYQLPTTPAGPAGITTGADGALWFAEETRQKIGRMTVDGGVSEYPVDGSLAYPPVHIVATTGADGGELWFTESGNNGDAIGHMSIDGTLLNEYSAAGVGGATITDTGYASILQDANGKVWFSEPYVSQIEGVPGDGGLPFSRFSTCPPPCNVMTPPAPGPMTVGPDGNLWFSDSTFSDGYIGYLQPSDGGLLVPEINNGQSSAIIFGPANAFWLALNAKVGIAHFDTSVSSSNLPTEVLITEAIQDQYAGKFFGGGGGGPTALTPGPDGAVWFIGAESGYVGRFGP